MSDEQQQPEEPEGNDGTGRLSRVAAEAVKQPAGQGKPPGEGPADGTGALSAKANEGPGGNSGSQGSPETPHDGRGEAEGTGLMSAKSRLAREQPASQGNANIEEQKHEGRAHEAQGQKEPDRVAAKAKPASRSGRHDKGHW